MNVGMLPVWFLPQPQLVSNAGQNQSATSTDGVNPRLMGVDAGYCSVKDGDKEEQYGGVLVDFSQEAKMASSTGS